MASNSNFRDTFLRLVAILGLIAVLVLGAWGIIQLGFYISTLFSGEETTQSVDKNETLAISMPAAVTSGNPVVVAWTHKNTDGTYSYALSYSCVAGLSFKAPTPSGAQQTVACDTAFNYTQAKSSLSITPTYTGTGEVRPTIKVEATQLSSGTITAHAESVLTVKAAAKATPAKTTTTKSSTTQATYTSSGRTTNLYGYPDLSVRILSAKSLYGNVTVQFEVTNVGTNVSPSNWTFNALLPINGSYTYPSGGQQALYPGDRIVYTLNYGGGTTAGTYGGGVTSGPYPTCNMYGPCAIPGYGNYYNQGQYDPYLYPNMLPGGTQWLTITVDPNNYLYELNKSNNYAQASYTL